MGSRSGRGGNFREMSLTFKDSLPGKASADSRGGSLLAGKLKRISKRACFLGDKIGVQGLSRWGEALVKCFQALGWDLISIHTRSKIRPALTRTGGPTLNHLNS